jgi:hypothetical protein|tara:strand:+ start:658 stop:789 length:132 start_codon:yes stop_codon:yes gene_type:complete
MGKGLKQILITIQERWAATRPNVYKNKKKYTRKQKHRGKDLDT